MFTIKKEFSFSASHMLHDMAEGHPCARLHGHNYVITLELWSKGLDDKGFVKDYGELNVVKDWINEKLDHRHLNEVLPIPNPTAELIAKYIYDIWKSKIRELHTVHVSETPKTNASYTEQYVV